MGSAQSGGLLTAIEIIWTVVRDVTNILIIGTFVYVAIIKIIGKADTQKWNRQVVTLLAVAFLINFSFFFTQFIIDISNWFTVQIYNAIMPESTNESFSLSEHFLQNFGMGTIMSAWITLVGSIAKLVGAKALASWLPGGWVGGLLTAMLAISTSPISTILYIVITTILFLLLAILFFRLAFIFIKRFIILIILLAFSSAAFAAMVIPGLNKWWKIWYEALIANATIAPVLLLLLWATDTISHALHTEQFQNTAFTGGWQTQFGDLRLLIDGLVAGATLGNTPTPFGQMHSIFISLLYLALMVGLLWAAIRIANILSEKATKKADFLGRIVSTALGHIEGYGYRATFGGLGWAGRNTLGRGFATMGDRLQDHAARISHASPTLSALYGKAGRHLSGIGGKGFDIRAMKSFNKAAAQFGMKSTGSAIKDGFAKIAEKKAKEQEQLKKRYDKKHREETEKALAHDAEMQRRNAQQQKELQKETAKLIKKQEESQKKIQKLTEQKAQLSKQQSNSQESQQALNEKVAELNRQRTEKLKDVASTEEVLQEIAGELGSEASKINRIKNQIARGDSQQALEDLQRLIEATQARMDTTDTQNRETAEYQNTKKYLRQLQQYNRKLRSKTRLDNEFMQAQQELNDTQQHIKGLGAQLEQITQQIVDEQNQQQEISDIIDKNKEHLGVLSETAELDKKRFNDKIDKAARGLTEYMALVKPASNIDITELEKQRLSLLKTLSDQNNSQQAHIRAQKELDTINKKLAEHALYERKERVIRDGLRKQVLMTDGERKSSAEQKRIAEQLQKLLEPSKPKADSARTHNMNNASATAKADNVSTS